MSPQSLARGISEKHILASSFEGCQMDDHGKASDKGINLLGNECPMWSHKYWNRDTAKILVPFAF